MTRPRSTSNESDLLAATISSLKSRLNQLESVLAGTGSQFNTGRNLIINGAMQIAQRSFSVSSITGPGYYTADRWNIVPSSLGTWRQTVENDAPVGSGFSRSLEMTVTTANASPSAGSFAILRQVIEGQNCQLFAKGTSSAKELTVSFWVKSNVTGTFIVELEDVMNSRRVSAPYTISTSGTWEKQTATFSADIIGTLRNDETGVLGLNFWLGAGSTYTSGTLQTTWAASVAANLAPGQTNLAATIGNYWQITGVQLEVGRTATDFDFESYDRTLAKCQRYYFKATTDSVLDNLGVGYNSSTTVGRFFRSFPVTMRVGPTAIEQSGTANLYFVGITGGSPGPACSAVPVFYSATKDGATFDFTVASGLTAGQGSIATVGSGLPFLAWSAEI